MGQPVSTPAERALELVEARRELDDAQRVLAMVRDVYTGPARLSRRMAVEVLVAERRVELWRSAVRVSETDAAMIGLRP
jgi:hypothetical protein